MKSKKLISLLCAAAMTTSAFAGLATTASAAAAPVWSFDGSSADGWSGAVTPTVATDEGSDDKYLDFLAGERTQATDQAETPNGITFTLPAEAQLTNDYVLEYDTNIHTSNGMGRLNQYTQLAFTGANPVLDTQDYGGDYATAAQEINPDDVHTWSTESNIGFGYAGDIVSSLTARIELQGNMVVNYDGTQAPTLQDGEPIGDSKWVRVRAEVKDGKAKVTIADSNTTLVDAKEYTVSATKLSQIMMCMGRADTSLFIPTTPANVKLDNIKVYDGIANAPAFSTEGLRKSAVVATPVPAPEKVAGAAPAYTAPESADTPYTAGFNGAQTGTIGYVEAADTDAKTVVDGMKVKFGSRSGGEDQKTYASIVKVADGDNALRLSADQFSTNGRGPVVSLDDNIDITDMTGTAVMGFAVYLSRTSTTGAERLFLLDNTDEGHVDGNSVARDVLAVITTEDIQNEDESYKYTAGEKNIGVHVDPEAWHYITVAVSGDAYRVFVDGQYKQDGVLAPALRNDLVGTGEDHKHAVTHLPLLAIENTKAYNEESGEGGTVYSTALIDNVLAYYVQGDLEPNILPSSGEAPVETQAPTPAPKHDVTIAYANGKATVSTEETEAFDGVLIAANYKADGTLEKVAKVEELKGISKDAAKEVTVPMAVGDKLMVWNSVSGMVPYGSYTVKADDTTSTPAPALTPKPTPTATTEVKPSPTATTEVNPSPTATTEVNPSPTATTEVKPSPTATTAVETPAPKYAVSGTVDAGVKTVALTPTEGKAIDGTIAEGKVTFADVPAGTYTITVTAKSGYEVDTIKVANADATTVTVTDADVTTLAITTKAEEVIAYADGTRTYDEEGDAVFFVNKGSTDNIAIANGDAAKGNATKVERVTSTVNNYRRANAIAFPDGFQATGTVKVTFDYLVNSRMSNVYIVGTDIDLGGAKAGADIETKNILGLVTNKENIAVNSGSAAATANLNVMSGWAHVEAVINTTAKTTDLKIYNYKANNNYEKETPVYTGEALAFTDNTITGVAGLYIAGTNGMDACFDNICMTPDEGYVAPIYVTATGAKVDKTAVKAGDVITITPVVPEGKKLTAVKVNDTAVTTTEDVTTGEGEDAVTTTVYKYTVKGDEKAIAVTAEFARADVTAVEITSTNTNIQKGFTGKYTATVKAGTTELADQTITWGVAVPTAEQLEAGETAVASKADGTTISNDGTLTVAADQAEGVLLVTASVIKDETVAAGTENTVVGTFKVTIIGEPVYQVVAAADMANGTVSFKVGEDAVTSVNESETLEIVPAPATGYSTTKVEYIKTADLTAETPVWTEVTATSDKYTVAGTALSGDITVKVTYTAIDYTITNGNATADGNNNSITIKVGDAAASTDASVTANYQNKITVVPVVADGYVMSALTYTVGDAGEPVNILSTKSFDMPAGNVTVNATFIVKPVMSEPLVIYSNDFETSSDFTAGGKTDGTTKNPDTSATKSSKVIGVGSGSGDKNLTSPSFTEVENYKTAVNDYYVTKFKVSFDFKIDGCSQGKGSNIALLGAASKSSWLDSDKQIFTIGAHCGSNGTFDQLTVNGADVMSALKESENTTYDIGSLNRDTTNWVTVDATIDFETKTVTYSMKKGENVVIAETTVDFVNKDTTVLDRLFIAAGKTYGGALVDNLSITAMQ